MMIPHFDRQPEFPNRVELVQVPGQPNVFDIIRRDNPTVDGTFINKAVLDDMLAAKNTTAGTATAYTLAQDGFVLKDGAPVFARLHVAMGQSPTLDVEDSGAIPIYALDGRRASGLTANTWVHLVCREQGTDKRYILQSILDTSGDYGVCSTAEATAAKTVTLNNPSWTQQAGAVIHVTHTYGVPANATLNANAKGAVQIWLGGARIVAGMIPANTRVTYLHDGTYWRVMAIDRAVTRPPAVGDVVWERAGVTVPNALPMTGGTFVGSAYPDLAKTGRFPVTAWGGTQVFNAAATRYTYDYINDLHYCASTNVITVYNNAGSLLRTITVPTTYGNVRGLVAQGDFAAALCSGNPAYIYATNNGYSGSWTAIAMNGYGAAGSNEPNIAICGTSTKYLYIVGRHSTTTTAASVQCINLSTKTFVGESAAQTVFTNNNAQPVFLPTRAESGYVFGYMPITSAAVRIFRCAAGATTLSDVVSSEQGSMTGTASDTSPKCVGSNTRLWGLSSVQARVANPANNPTALITAVGEAVGQNYTYPVADKYVLAGTTALVAYPDTAIGWHNQDASVLGLLKNAFGCFDADSSFVYRNGNITYKANYKTMTFSLFDIAREAGVSGLMVPWVIAA